jgi:hypothetical protein
MSAAGGGIMLMVAPTSRNLNDCQDLQANHARETLASHASQLVSAPSRHSAIELSMLAELGDFGPQPSWYLLDETFDDVRVDASPDDPRTRGFSEFTGETIRSSKRSPVNSENESASLMRTAVIVMILPALVAMLAAAGALLDRAQVGWVSVLLLLLSFVAVYVLLQLRDQLGGRAVTAMLTLILLANPLIGLAIIASLSTW